MMEPTMERHVGWTDVSVPLRSGMVHWPGDPAVSIELVSDMARGHDANVTAIDMGAHTGTHVDAPLHFLPGATSLDGLDPDVMIGPARVIAIEDPVMITTGELAGHDVRAGERVLFKTRNSERCWATDDFIEDFVYVAEEAAAALAALPVQLVGVDYLSVGGFHADGPAIHRHLLGAGVWILEGLDLRGVEPGGYDLLCLPLRLAGADGAPARALLRPRS
jgi:arylformamidase